MRQHTVKSEKEWLELRKQYITASQAAVLVGADPYSSPNKLRQESTFTGNSYTQVGQLLEPIVVNVTNQVLGTTFQLYETEPGQKVFFTEGVLGATPDAHMNNRVLLECKTCRPQIYMNYSSVPPDKYLIQLMVQLICTDLLEGYLAIMSTDLTQNTQQINWPISIYKVWKNEELCDILKSEAQRFKDNPTFRVSSDIKQRVKLMLSICYQREDI